MAGGAQNPERKGIMALRYGTRAAALAVVLWGAVAAPGYAAGANVVGVWKGSMETQMGAVENTITIDAATPLAGTVKVGDYQGKLEKGKVDGERISFLITIDPGTITYEGTVTGDEMKLTVTGTTGNKMTLVAKRQK